MRKHKGHTQQRQQLGDDRNSIRIDVSYQSDMAEKLIDIDFNDIALIRKLFPASFEGDNNKGLELKHFLLISKIEVCKAIEELLKLSNEKQKQSKKHYKGNVARSIKDFHANNIKNLKEQSKLLREHRSSNVSSKNTSDDNQTSGSNKRKRSSTNAHSNLSSSTGASLYVTTTMANSNVSASVTTPSASSQKLNFVTTDDSENNDKQKRSNTVTPSTSSTNISSNAVTVTAAVPVTTPDASTQTLNSTRTQSVPTVVDITTTKNKSPIRELYHDLNKEVFDEDFDRPNTNTIPLAISSSTASTEATNKRNRNLNTGLHSSVDKRDEMIIGNKASVKHTIGEHATTYNQID